VGFAQRAPAVSESLKEPFFLFVIQGLIVTYWWQTESQRPMSKDLSSGNDLVRNSSLYKEFQAELDEILRHKWIESEKAGRDIGFEQALTDWIMKHRSKWRRARQAPVAQ